MNALRCAFDATMLEKAFLAEADKSNWEITPVNGEEIETLMKRVYATPLAIIDLAQKVTPQPR